jgi:hypothetical protein
MTATKRAQRAASEARMAAQRAATTAAVRAGCCPDCGASLRRNSALAGWWQCSQFGAVGFRADSSRPSCLWQGFTE